MRQSTPLLHAAIAGATIVGASLATAPSVGAAPMTFVVDTLSAEPGDGFTIYEALFAANTNAGLDTIEFAPELSGTINLTSGTLSFTDHVVIDGPGSGQLTFNGGGSTRIIHSLVGNIDFTLNGVTLANGDSAAAGGALALAAPGEVTFDDVAITDSRSATLGGGAYINDPSGLVTMTNTRFERNQAGPSGGGLYLADSALVNDDIVFENVTFEGNEADEQGGAVVAVKGRRLNASQLTVIGNTATAGSIGGIELTAATVSLQDSVIDGNTATGFVGGISATASDGEVRMVRVDVTNNSSGSIGGGVVNATGSAQMFNSTVMANDGSFVGGVRFSATSTVVLDSSFETNTGTSYGGALIFGDAASVNGSSFLDNVGNKGAGLSSFAASTLVERTTMARNIASPVTGVGGGLYFLGTTLEVTQSTLSDNTAHLGGGIYIEAGAATIGYSTVVDNAAATSGGGIYTNDTNLSLDRTILSDNTAPAFPDTNDTTLDLDFSLLGDDTGIAINGADNIIGADPQLSPLADNGGQTLTHLPAADSPVVDAGGTPILPNEWTDQRERPRPSGPVDIGSVEVAGVGSLWTPVTPARIVDTRTNGETIDGLNEADGRIAAGAEIRFPVAGRAGVPDDAIGVVANITAIKPARTGYVTTHPCVTPLPLAASLNYTAGVNLGNEIIIGLDAGELCLFSSGEIDVTVDVVGYVPAFSPYNPIEPSRLLDTREGGTTVDGLFEGVGAPGAGGEIVLTVGNRAGMAKAEAVVVYVAAIGADATGFVTVWDCLADRPLTSSLNHVAGVNRGNEIVATVQNGDICLYTEQDVDLTVDAVGYFRIEGHSNFEQLTGPSRLLDTRPNGETIDDLFEAGGKLEAGETVTLDVSGRAGVGPNAMTVSMNLTAIAPEAVGFVTAYPCGTLPLTASVNYVPGVNGGNEIIASVSDAGQVCLFTSAPVHLTADVTGSTSS